MRFDTQAVTLDSIDLQDDTCRISTLADPAQIDALADSISQLGLLQIPLILEKDRHRFIVSGFRRVAAWRQLGRTDISCRILDAKTPERVWAQLAVAENAWQRPLNLMEKARAFALLGRTGDDQVRLAKQAVPLGLVENPAMIGKLIQLSHLPGFIQQAVENGIIGLAMALMLGALVPEEGRSMLDLFQTFQLGLNQQRELLTLIKEIAHRESISIDQVLASKEMTAITGSSDPERSPSTDALRFYLKKRRYPSLTETETKFMRLKQQLQLGPRTRINPPRYFEGKSYQLTLTFDTLDELAEHGHVVQKLSRHPELKAFLD